jgi:hypothetical protein
MPLSSGKKHHLANKELKDYPIKQKVITLQKIYNNYL